MNYQQLDFDTKYNMQATLLIKQYAEIVQTKFGLISSYRVIEKSDYYTGILTFRNTDFAENYKKKLFNLKKEYLAEINNIEND